MHALDWLILAALAIEGAYDRFSTLNDFADAIERRWFPAWLQYGWWGDKITWVQHGVITASAGCLGGLLHLLTNNTFRIGYLHFAGALVVFYLVRECFTLWMNFRTRYPGMWVRHDHHRGTGWLIDGVLDVIFPALAWFAGWRLM